MFKSLIVSLIIGGSLAAWAVDRNGNNGVPETSIGGKTATARDLANNFGEPRICRNGKYADPATGTCP